MITRVKTDKGESWAIVLHPCNSLEDIGNMARNMIELMITATSSELFDSSKEGFYWTLTVLKELIATSDQRAAVEAALWKNGEITKPYPHPDKG